MRRFSAQEHDTDRTVPIRALLWDFSFTKYICVYMCKVSLSAVCCIIQSYILSELFIESKQYNRSLQNLDLLAVL